MTKTRNEISPILIAIHNACVLLEEAKGKLLEEHKPIYNINRDIETLNQLALNINNQEKSIIENVLSYFNDEIYNEAWESVKTWYDKKGNLKVLRKHDYDFSMEVLKNIFEQLQKKYLEDFEIENKLIL